MNPQRILSIQVVHVMYAGIHVLILGASVFLKIATYVMSQKSDHKHELIMMP